MNTNNEMPATFDEWPEDFKKIRGNIIFKNEMILLHTWFKDLNKLVIFLKNNINKIDNFFDEFNSNNKIPEVRPVPIRLWADTLGHMDTTLFFDNLPNEKHHYDKISKYKDFIEKIIIFINKHPNIKRILDDIWGRAIDSPADPLELFKRYLDGLFVFATLSNNKQHFIIRKERLEEEYSKKNNRKIKRKIIDEKNNIKRTAEMIEQVLNTTSETYKKNQIFENEIAFITMLGKRLGLDEQGLVDFLIKVNKGDENSINIRDSMKKEFDVKLLLGMTNLIRMKNLQIWNTILQDYRYKNKQKTKEKSMPDSISEGLKSRASEAEAEEEANKIADMLMKEEEEELKKISQNKTKKKKKKKKKKRKL